MRFSLHEWRRQILYFKRRNFQDLQKVRGFVNTVAFFIVWGYAGYYIASRADQSARETGIPHSVQLAKISGAKYITKYNFDTGKTEQISRRRVNCIEMFSCFIGVDQVFAEKELEARRKILEERRLREEARLAPPSSTPDA